MMQEGITLRNIKTAPFTAWNFHQHAMKGKGYKSNKEMSPVYQANKMKVNGKLVCKCSFCVAAKAVPANAPLPTNKPSKVKANKCPPVP